MMRSANQDLGPAGFAVRTGVRLRPDPSRITIKLFVARQEDFGPTQSRTNAVVRRVMALSDAEARTALEEIERDFAFRHPDFDQWLDLNAHRALHRFDPKVPLSEDKWRMIGACFTHEFALEGAALCNPSAVEHPDQSGLPPGTKRFVMSTRAIGEGHRSAIGFRTGTIDASGHVVVDGVRPEVHTGITSETRMNKAAFRSLLEPAAPYADNAAEVMSGLQDTFSVSDLEERLNVLHHDRDTYRNVEETLQEFRLVAQRFYMSKFPSDVAVSERALWPHADVERRGMEDARFTRFTERDGSVAYFASYTAFDGVNITQQGLRTVDFTHFHAFPVSGDASRGKGLALFPRHVDGRYAALVRPDYESNQIAFSDSVEHWETSETIQVPARPWEVIQLGNCGAPVETEAGWLVVTHAVGPFRTYYLGAILLDRDDPQRVLGTLDQPLLSPAHDERDGYVPNVVYSCGSMVHAGRLMIPFGIADHSIGIATVRMEELLGRLTGKEGKADR